MTSRRSILLGFALAAFLGAFGLNSVFAQVPRNISYQGLLVKNGQPVNGQVDLHLIIYDASGNNLYEESHSATVTNGVFNVVIGGSNGLNGNLKFDQQYLLGVNVDGTGEVTPRTAFTAAPYALNAQTVGGVGVSVTPQAGMLLPLDQNSKIPKSALPDAVQSVTTINGVTGDATNSNITLTGTNGITITPNIPGNSIAIGFSGGAGGIQTVVAGPGLTGGGSAPGQTSVTLQVAQNGITTGMLGNNSVTGVKLDQQIPQRGLYQNAVGNLNVGLEASLTLFQFGSPQYGSTDNPLNPLRNIGIDMNHTNTWLAPQNFNGMVTFNGGVILNSSPNFTLNGTPEPTVGANGATIYEINDNGDLLVTGSATVRGNTFVGAGPTNTQNSIGNIASQPTNNVNGLTNNITATSTGATAASNTITANGSAAGNSNNLVSQTNNIGAGQSAGGTNNIGNNGISTNNVNGATNTLNASTSNNLVSQTNNVGAGQSAGGVNNIGNTNISTNNVQGVTNNVGTTQSIGGVNNVGTSANSTNNVNGLNNNVTATGTNSIQAPANNLGTTQVAGGTNTIGTLSVSTNTINGLTNSSQAQTINSGTNQTGGGVITIGNLANSTVTINGLNNTMTSSSTNNLLGPTNNINAATNNLGTNAGSANNIGTASSTNIVNGTTTFNGIHNVNGATTIVGSLTQSGGLVALAGAAGANSFGSASGANNTIGNAANSTNIVQGTTNTLQGGTNNLLGTTNNVNAATNNIGTVTGQANNIGTGGTSTNTIGVGGSGTNSIQAGTNNIGTVGASSNTIGTAGSSTNVINGSSNTVNGPLLVNGTTTTTGNLILGNASTTNTYGAAGSANRFNGTSNFGTLPASNGNKLIVDGVVTPGVLSSSDYELVVNGDMQVTGTASIATLIIPGGTFCISNLQVGTLSQLCSAPAGTAITLADAFTQSSLNANANNTFLATNFTGIVSHSANITQTSGTAQFLNTQVNGTLGSTGNTALGSAAATVNSLGNSGTSQNTIQGTTNTMTATTSIPGTGVNLLQASGVGSANTLTAPNNNLNGILTQIGNAFFGDNVTPTTTTFRLDNINGNNNSTISNFTTIQANNSMTIGTPAAAATTLTSNTNGAAVSTNLPNTSGSGRIGTMEGWRLALVPATGPNGGGFVSFNAGSVVPNPIYPNGFVVTANSVVMVRYVGHNVGVPTGQLWVTVSGANVNVESSAALDNNTVEILIMNP